MKKTYLFPLTRTIDLSMEVGCLGDLSQLPIPGSEGGSEEEVVESEDQALTNRQGIWGWTSDK